MKKLMIIIFSISLTHFVFCAPQPKKQQKLSGKLIVFHAGSLSVPFKKMASAFEKKHPEVKILLEAGGSRTCARKISDLHRPCDIMASADYTVINELLIPVFADWNIRFAANEMTIVYHAHSRKSANINKNNWYQVLMDKKVIFGRSDPNCDPCGYRAVLTMKLAEIFYKKPELAEKMLKKKQNFIRPKETDLLALLESNTIDYIFLYRSVAEQHKLKYLLLPDEINLKSAKFADFYQKAQVKVSGKKPGTFIVKTGAPMVYGVTIPKNAPNPQAALAFIQFLLNKNDGMKVMLENGQPSVIPSVSLSYNKIPQSLRQYALPVNK